MSNSGLINKSAIIGKNVNLGNNVVIKDRVIIEDNVSVGDNTVIEYNCIIRSNVQIGADSYVGANSILGEKKVVLGGCDQDDDQKLVVGNNAVIRSATIIYSGTTIGDNFQTGHNVTIREKAVIGNNTSVGTLSDIQGHCQIGNYVRMHSNVHVGMQTVIDDCCWIYPYTVFTNDPTPPSETEVGAHVHPFAIVATGSIVLPGIDIASDSLIGAGTIVNKNVERYQVVVGNPGRVKGDIRNIKNRDTGDTYYPWRYSFERNMPWQGIGFEEWLSQLDDDSKKLIIGNINQEVDN